MEKGDRRAKVGSWRRAGGRSGVITHPELLEGVGFTGGLTEQGHEIDPVALGLQVGHQARSLLHLLGGWRGMGGEVRRAVSVLARCKFLGMRARGRRGVAHDRAGNDRRGRGGWGLENHSGRCGGGVEARASPVSPEVGRAAVDRGLACSFSRPFFKSLTVSSAVAVALRAGGVGAEHPAGALVLRWCVHRVPDRAAPRRSTPLSLRAVRSGDAGAGRGDFRAAAHEAPACASPWMISKPAEE